VFRPARNTQHAGPRTECDAEKAIYTTFRLHLGLQDIYVLTTPAAYGEAPPQAAAVGSPPSPLTCTSTSMRACIQARCASLSLSLGPLTSLSLASLA